GDSGPSIVPGNAEASLLIEAIRYDDPHLQMPEDEKLPDATIADLEKWIQSGAPAPQDWMESQKLNEDVSNEEKWQQHWSFQPLRSSGKGANQSIDHFITSALQEKGLTLAPQAVPVDLIRRLHYDLTGLPPQPEIVDQLVGQWSENTYRELVDQLLDTPQYGEKWGRFWLDLARYSETAGGGRSYPVPSAWRYRNYVIDAMNADMPYRQFLTEQIAGDLLESKDDNERSRHLIATGFLALGAKPLDFQDKEQLMFDHIDEQLDTIGKTTMGMTVGCARCHDHMFDPISERDYYRMASIMQNTKAMDEALINNFAFVTLPGAADSVRKEAKGAIEKSRKLLDRLSNLEKQSTSSAAEKRKEALKELEDLIDQSSQASKAIAVVDNLEFIDGFIRIRGVAIKKGASVERGAPLEMIAQPQPKPVPEDESGRRQLVDWITHPEHPLTYRVYVNRVWAQLFGKGLVASLDNFGITGNAPTHPELLDYLARQFLENGGSTKDLVRQVVLSQTYQQSAQVSDSEMSTKLDPDRAWLSGYPTRRLTAEELRDSVLQSCDQINKNKVEGVVPASQLLTSHHRSVYLPVQREEGLHPLLEVFDFADPNLSTGRRNVTNLPTQSLYLLNSEFIQQKAKNTAEAALAREKLTDPERLDFLAKQIYSRPLTDKETSFCMQQLEQAQNKATDRLEAWSIIAHALYCSPDFRFLK
ncbi:MAG: PSD1 and planctomycete cytochrome C domain-containing protein, partial [Verrucomicrobiota bacterium]